MSTIKKKFSGSGFFHRKRNQNNDEDNSEQYEEPERVGSREHTEGYDCQKEGKDSDPSATPSLEQFTVDTRCPDLFEYIERTHRF